MRTKGSCLHLLPSWVHTYLGNCSGGAVTASRHLNHRVTHLQCPGVHDFLDTDVCGECVVFVGCCRQVLPEVVLLCVLVFPEGEGDVKLRLISDFVVLAFFCNALYRWIVSVCNDICLCLWMCVCVCGVFVVFVFVCFSIRVCACVCLYVHIKWPKPKSTHRSVR